MAVVHGRPGARPSRRMSAGLVALRPDRDGTIVGYEGLDEVQRRFGAFMMDQHLPGPGSRAAPIEGGFVANAWMRFKHPDYDTLREILDAVGKIVKVRAR